MGFEKINKKKNVLVLSIIVESEEECLSVSDFFSLLLEFGTIQTIFIASVVFEIKTII